MNAQTTGTPPSERTDHSAVLYEDAIYIFAGYDGHSRYNDLYKISLKKGKLRWKAIQTDGTIPLNRFGHTAIVH